MTTSRSHEDAKLGSFRADPAYASDDLNAVLEDGDQEEWLETRRDLAQASCDNSKDAISMKRWNGPSRH